MPKFCGQEKCLIDANGRVKLAPRFEREFREEGAAEIVLHCLPEGGLGAYPPAVWDKIRAAETDAVMRSATSVVARRQLRRFGAMTQAEELSNQGRITIPAGFRGMLGLEPGTEVVLVGCECGVEVWNAGRWQEEQKRLWEHEALRAEAEMKADVASAGRPGGEEG